MNLIEKLGGYEKAKEALIAGQRSKNIDPVIYINGDEVLIDAIDDALLDHRRQHNIFEVGDNVVFINQNMSSSVKAVKEILNDTHVSFNFHGFHIELIRHATDAEIEAGKRLGVS